MQVGIYPGYEPCEPDLAVECLNGKIYCVVQVKQVKPGRQVHCIEALLKAAGSAEDQANMLEELDTFNKTAQEYCPAVSAARERLEVSLLRISNIHLRSVENVRRLHCCFVSQFSILESNALPTLTSAASFHRLRTVRQIAEQASQPDCGASGGALSATVSSSTRSSPTRTAGDRL